MRQDIEKILGQFAMEQKRIQPNISTELATEAILELIKGAIPEELLLTSQTGQDMKQLVVFGYNMCRQAMLDKLEDKS